jgi:hypothetical protein
VPENNLQLSDWARLNFLAEEERERNAEEARKAKLKEIREQKEMLEESQRKQERREDLMRKHFVAPLVDEHDTRRRTNARKVAEAMRDLPKRDRLWVAREVARIAASVGAKKRKDWDEKSYVERFGTKLKEIPEAYVQGSWDIAESLVGMGRAMGGADDDQKVMLHRDLLESAYWSGKPETNKEDNLFFNSIVKGGARIAPHIVMGKAALSFGTGGLTAQAGSVAFSPLRDRLIAEGVPETEANTIAGAGAGLIGRAEGMVKLPGAGRSTFAGVGGAAGRAAAGTLARRGIGGAATREALEAVGRHGAEYLIEAGAEEGTQAAIEAASSLAGAAVTGQTEGRSLMEIPREGLEGVKHALGPMALISGLGGGMSIAQSKQERAQSMQIQEWVDSNHTPSRREWTRLGLSAEHGRTKKQREEAMERAGESIAAAEVEIEELRQMGVQGLPEAPVAPEGAQARVQPLATEEEFGESKASLQARFTDAAARVASQTKIAERTNQKVRLEQFSEAEAAEMLGPTEDGQKTSAEQELRDDIANLITDEAGALLLRSAAMARPDKVNGAEGDEAAAKARSKFDEVERRKQASRRENIPFLGRVQKLKDWAKRIGASLTRSQVHLPNTPKWEFAHETERQKQEVRSRSVGEAAELIQNVMNLMGPNQQALYEAFMTTRAQQRNRNMLSRVKEEAEEGIIHPEPLRWGYKNDEQIEEDLAKYIADIMPTEDSPGTPEVRDAIQARDEMIRGVVEQAVGAGVLPKAVLNNVDGYVHQQVFAKNEMMRQERDAKGIIAKGKGFLKRRVLGPEELEENWDPNAAYLEPELLWISDALEAIHLKQLDDALIERYDRYAEFEQEAEETGKDISAIAKQNDFLVVDRSRVSQYTPDVFDAVSEQYDVQMAGVLGLSEAQADAAYGDGQGRKIAMPARVLRQLRENQEKFVPPWIMHAANKATSSIKAWLLNNPLTTIGYGLRNLYGDGEVVVAAVPTALRPSNVNRTWKQVWTLYRNPSARDERTDAALKYGAIGSGHQAVELAEAPGRREFREATGQGKGALAKVLGSPGTYMRTVQDFHEMRENYFRMLVFNEYLDLINSGKLKNFGGAKRANAEAVIREFGPEAGAAYLSRKTIGDYRDVTEAGNFARRSLFPFYAFVEINAKRYPRIAWNALRAGNIALAPVVAARLAGGYLVAYLFNQFIYPFLSGDEDWEEDLSEHEKQSLGFNVGRLADGTILRYRNMGALNELFETIGLNEMISDMPDYYKGDLPVSRAPNEMGKALLEKFYGLLHPFAKGPGEIATGRSKFPDPTGPGRPISQAEAWGNLLGVGKQMDALAGKIAEDGRAMRPNQGWRFTGTGVIYPKREALRDYYSYWDRYVELNDLPEKGAFPISTIRPGREAATNNNREAFSDWYSTYTEKEGPGAAKKFVSYLKRMDPLMQVPTAHRKAFYEGLDKHEKERVDNARLYAADLRDTMLIWYKEERANRRTGNGGMSR